MKLNDPKKAWELKDLEDDEEFFEGLRSGEFCLVLGAGFSYGLKNKTSNDQIPLKEEELSYDLYKNIPLAKDFIFITNQLFNQENNDYQFSANLWNNKVFNSDDNILKKFFENLFSLDRDWFMIEKYGLYKNILIPNWHQIFTFNFDDVIENIVELDHKDNEYQTLYYPENTNIDSKNYNTAIAHLHGYIKKTPFNVLVFHKDGYTKFEKKDHTLYDPLFSEMNSGNGKKLFILGAQFTENIISKLLFNESKDHRIIYYFNLNDHNISTESYIDNNPNYHFIKISGTEEVLQFLRDHKERIENIKIDGAEVITKGFKKKITENGCFTAEEFYLAKGGDICQWYGIAQGWDVKRNIYDQIKEEVLKSFRDEKRNSKISAVVYGRGGSGKSTLLRRLGWDLSEEDFAVLWVKDIESFYNEGFNQIKTTYQHKKFLVIIDDLYQIKEQPSTNIKKIIADICEYQKIRIVIGDRPGKDGSYSRHVYNSFELKATVEDNRETINSILKNVEVWKETACSLLRTDEAYKSSLYIILWTIGRTYKKNITDDSINKTNELKGYFQEIVISDMKAIAKKYPGLAKMLYYAASIYAKHKLIFPYERFFDLADLFKSNSVIESRDALHSKEIGPILESYIHCESGIYKSIGEMPLVAFNQDILAEEGLADAKLEEWESFHNGHKLKMLNKFLENDDKWGIRYFFVMCLLSIPDNVYGFGKKGKKMISDRLLEKGFYGPYILIAFQKNLYNDQEKKIIANKILEQKEFWKLPVDIVCTVLNISKDIEKANEILEQKEFWHFPKEIVGKALSISNNRYDKANEIIRQEEFWTLPNNIVCMALKISKDKERAKEFLEQKEFWKISSDIASVALDIAPIEGKTNAILKDEKFWELPKEIVCKALKISKDIKKAKEFLELEKFWELSPQITCAAFDISKNEDKANEFLEQNNCWELSHEITCAALDITKNESIANEILSKKEYWKSSKHGQIVCTALNVSKNESIANEILSQKDYLEFPNMIISKAFTISKNEKLKKSISETILSREQWKEHWNIAFHCLSYMCSMDLIPEYASLTINQIINKYKYNRDTQTYFCYKNLMKIPFFTHPLWLESALDTIYNWQKRGRDLVTNTIIAYKSKPYEINKMCKSILMNWKREMEKEIHIDKHTIHYGDHIKLSLGHPNLKEIARETALEIKEHENRNTDSIPDYLLEIADQIINEDQFPLWDEISN